MAPSDDRSPAVPRRRFLGGMLVAAVSADATGVSALFVAAVVAAAGRHPHDATGLLLVALVGLAGVLLALIAIPAAVRSFSDARRVLETTRHATVLISVGFVINTVGALVILVAGPATAGPASVLLLVTGDAVSILYLALLRGAAREARDVR